MTHFLQRTVLVLSAAGALTACATTEDASLRPKYPITQPGEEALTPPTTTPAPIPSDAPTTPTPTPSVESRSLEPLTPAAPRAVTPPPAATPAPVAPRPTVYETVTKKSVTGKVVDVDGPPKTHKVKKGENLEKIAKALDTDVETLAKDNKLKKPYLIKPGETLKGPHSDAKAYVVGSGDTLFSIARRFGVTAAAMAGENDMSTSDPLKVGRKLTLPSGYKDSGPLTTTTRVAVEQPAPRPVRPPVQREPEPTPRPVTPTPETRPAPTPVVPAPVVRQQTPPPVAAIPTPQPATRPVVQPPVTTPAPVARPAPTAQPAPSTATPSASDAQISQVGRGRFLWPLQGEVISDFGPKAAGQRNDGINIRTRAGEPVRAAAAGDVVYAGDQVPGFGNLVLIKHADGWVTAYGHLARVDVKMQQKITQGQQIGQAGESGGVSEPQLHFEVRYAATAAERARPIDPRLVLPR